jgi:hypothetical protein
MIDQNNWNLAGKFTDLRLGDFEICLSGIEEERDRCVDKCPLISVSIRSSESPDLLLKRLGITYLISIPQAIGECWQFFGCEKIPNEISEDDGKYLSFNMEYRNPHRSVGRGLSKDSANLIQKWIDLNIQ